MKRLFVAVPLTEEIKEQITPLREELKASGADLKLVALENLHFTLKFLGDVDENKIPAIVEKLFLLQWKPFSLSVRGVGVFPSLERINVVWVGIESVELIALMKKINQTLNYIRKEEHPETPHLTIARVKSGRNKEQLPLLAEKYKNTLFGEMKVDKIILFESGLGKDGLKYEMVGRSH